MKYGIDTLDKKSFLSFYSTYSSPKPFKAVLSTYSSPKQFKAVLIFIYNSLIMRYVTSAVVTNPLPRSRESLEHLKMTTI